MQVEQEQASQAPQLSAQAVEAMWSVTADKIVSAVEQIVAIAQPVRVVAFGSRARGDHKSGSDLDLAVIVKKYDKLVDPRPVWRADLDVRMDMDVVVYDVERERNMSNSPVSLQALVRQEGVQLYDSETATIDRLAAARLV